MRDTAYFQQNSSSEMGRYCQSEKKKKIPSTEIISFIYLKILKKLR